MTWQDWIESNYNIKGYINWSGILVNNTKEFWISKDGYGVDIQDLSDIIENGHEYYHSSYLQRLIL